MLRLKHAEFRHQNGLALFADRALAACLREYSGIKTAAAARIQVLKEQAKALRQERTRLDPDSALSFEELVRHARQLHFEQTLWCLLIAAEGALTYFAAMLVIPGRGVIPLVLRALIAVVTTAMAAVTAEKFVDEWFYIPVSQSENESRVHRRRMWTWAVCLLVLESALWGLASVRSADIEAGTRNSVLYVGMILLSLILPPAAGAVRHDLMQRLAPVRRAERLRVVDSELEEGAKLLSAARHDLEAAWETMTQEWFATFAHFRAHKEVWNRRKQISEATAGRYFDSGAAFAAEARKRRDATYGELELMSDDHGPLDVPAAPPTLTLAVPGRDHAEALAVSRAD